MLLVTPSALEGIVACALPQLGVIEFRGDDRAAWLDGLVTWHVQSLAPGESRYTLALDLKGRCLTDLTLTATEDRLLAVLGRDAVQPLIAELKKRLVIEDVHIADRSEDLGVVSLYGADAPEAVESFDLAMSSTRIGEPGYDVLVPRHEMELAVDRLRDEGALTCSEEALEPWRIEAAIPRFGVDFDTKTIPLEAGLTDAIHWGKGCYLGQETLARLAHRGHTNKELRRLTLEGPPPPPGVELRAEDSPKPVGRVTSAAVGPRSGATVVLAWIRRTHFEAGRVLSLHAPDGVRDARVDDVGMRSHVPRVAENDPTFTRNAKQTGLLR